MKISILLIIILAIMVLSPIVSADTIICDYCKEPIKSQYIESNGKYFHPIHFKCAGCGTVIGHLPNYLQNGKHYCEKCYLEMTGMVCAHCGKLIKSEYYIKDGKKYHKSCFDEHIGAKCVICGDLIVGDYYTNYFGEKYCAKHKDDFKSCYYCGRMITDTYDIRKSDLGDGRHVCFNCRNNAVTSRGQALQLFKEAKQRLAKEGIDIGPAIITLELVDKDELHRASKSGLVDPNGLTVYNSVSQGGEIVDREFTIFLLANSPEADFITAAAHELMHVWIFTRHDNTDLNAQWLEGSCNYGAYLVLKQKAGDEVRHAIHMLNNDPSSEYGDGFRRVKRLVGEKGVGYWLDWLESNIDFPSGY